MYSSTLKHLTTFCDTDQSKQVGCLPGGNNDFTANGLDARHASGTQGRSVSLAPNKQQRFDDSRAAIARCKSILLSLSAVSVHCLIDSHAEAGLPRRKQQ